MGGSVGLKGTDGYDVLKKALNLGATPIAPQRAEAFLSELSSITENIQFIVGAGKMGENEAKNYGFPLTVVGTAKETTTAKDTKEVANRIQEMGADLLVFCGGDGTARDVTEIIQKDLPTIGVPTGVKMHSAVFAVAPEAAAKIAADFLMEKLPLREVEVMDVDEDAFREGQLAARLYGYVVTPYSPTLLQGRKLSSSQNKNELYNKAALGTYVIENMDPHVIYIIGPGTTTRTIAELLDTDKSLLGVDLFYDKHLIAKDVNENQILHFIKEHPAKIVVSPIGGQGFIFGRGNQQISPEVIRKVGIDNILVMATKQKIHRLDSLRIDTTDSKLDKTLSGYTDVVVDYNEKRRILTTSGKATIMPHFS